jgi:hypothetical protein
MAIGIALVIASIFGMIYGTINKKKTLSVISAFVFLMVIAVWIYFYNNPY